jgi:excisionase family DNA binding protein
MAVGFAIAKEMMAQTGGIMAQSTPAAAAPAAPPAAAAALPEVLTPADAAASLGVSEADVIASLESGDLKGKRIGSQWRVTRAALAAFLQ